MIARFKSVTDQLNLFHLYLSHVTTLPRTVTEFGFELYDAIAIMEQTIGCSELVKREVEFALSHNGEFSNEFTKTLDNFFLQDPELRVQECLDDDRDEDDNSPKSQDDSWFMQDYEICDQPKLHKSHTKAEDSFEPQAYTISVGAQDMKLLWQSVEVKSTPNSAALFQATALIRNQVDSEVYYASPTKSPLGNRNMETRRLYSHDTSVGNENPGIIATFLYQGSMRFRQPICAWEYKNAWPYLLCCQPTDDETNLTPGARTVLAHLDSRLEKREADCPFIKEVRVQDAVDLIRLLDVVSCWVSSAKVVML